MWGNMIVQKIRSASQSNGGMTLVEVMIALVIVLVLMLGLIQTAILSIDGNLRNVFRDEATRIGEQYMGDLRSYPFNQLVAGNTPFGALAGGKLCLSPPTTMDLKRNFREVIKKDYTVCITIASMDPSNTTISLQVGVGWNHKQEKPIAQWNNLTPTGPKTEFQHIVNSVMRQ